MSRQPSTDTDRLHAHGQLMLQLAGHLDNGQTIPCTGRNRDAWTSDDPEHQEYAAAQCLSCPARRACRAYVTEYPEPSNSVWAGMTLTERNTNRTK